MIQVDVAIATYNGGKRLGRTLDSLVRMAAAMPLGRDDWQLIVADNASTDDTRAVLAAYADRLPLTVVDAAMPGKSHAMNAAIDRMASNLIVFTDDDVTVRPDWLAKMMAGADAHPDYAVFSGRIVGLWEAEPPASLKSWIPMTSTYAVHDDDLESGPCDPGIVWGPNCAIRRAALATGQRFNTAIGPTPDAFYAMGEDSEIARRLEERGFKCYFLGDAIVEHTIKAATIGEGWITRRAERLAYGLFAIDPARAYTRVTKLPPDWEIWLRLRFWQAVYPFMLLLPRWKHRFWSKWKFFYYRGLLKGYRKFMR